MKRGIGVKMVDEKTKIKEIGYPDEFEDLINFNDDIEIADNLKEIITKASKNELLQVIKVIGSSPIKIESVEIYNEKFLLDNF